MTPYVSCFVWDNIDEAQCQLAVNELLVYCPMLEYNIHVSAPESLTIYFMDDDGSLPDDDMKHSFHTDHWLRVTRTVARYDPQARLIHYGS